MTHAFNRLQYCKNTSWVYWLLGHSSVHFIWPCHSSAACCTLPDVIWKLGFLLFSVRTPPLRPLAVQNCSSSLTAVHMKYENSPCFSELLSFTVDSLQHFLNYIGIRCHLLELNLSKKPYFNWATQLSYFSCFCLHAHANVGILWKNILKNFLLDLTEISESDFLVLTSVFINTSWFYSIASTKFCLVFFKKDDRTLKDCRLNTICPTVLINTDSKQARSPLNTTKDQITKVDTVMTFRKGRKFAWLGIAPAPRRVHCVRQQCFH